MHVEPKAIRLKDGRTALIRAPELTDAEELVRYLRDTAAETDFLLRYPDEVTLTVPQEETFLTRVLANPNEVMLVCEVDGHLAGNCSINFYSKRKERHRATIGIALRQAYWGLGIGTALFEEMLRIARAREGLLQLELSFIEGNSRARGLYEKMGFRIVGVHPDAIRLANGQLRSDYLMMLKL